MEKGYFLCFFLLFSNVKNIRDSLSFLLPYSMRPFQLCKIGIHFEVLPKCTDKSTFHRRQSKKILNKYSIYSRTGGKFQREKMGLVPYRCALLYCLEWTSWWAVESQGCWWAYSEWRGWVRWAPASALCRVIIHQEQAGSMAVSCR